MFIAVHANCTKSDVYIYIYTHRNGVIIEAAQCQTFPNQNQRVLRHPTPKTLCSQSPRIPELATPLLSEPKCTRSTARCNLSRRWLRHETSRAPRLNRRVLVRSHGLFVQEIKIASPHGEAAACALQYEVVMVCMNHASADRLGTGYEQVQCMLEAALTASAASLAYHKHALLPTHCWKVSPMTGATGRVFNLTVAKHTN